MKINLGGKGAREVTATFKEEELLISDEESFDSLASLSPTYKARRELQLLQIEAGLRTYNHEENQLPGDVCDEEGSLDLKEELAPV